MNGNISWLVSCPITDGNFRAHLNAATLEELKAAYDKVAKQEHAKTKLVTLIAKIRAKEKEGRK